MNIASTTAAPLTPKKEWTVLVYSASDNDLYSFMHKDLDEMEVVGSTPQMDIVAQFDQGRGRGAQRLHVEKDATPDELMSPVVQSLGATDMASPRTLADFIDWGVKNYPAEHYMLVISDHGNGWRGACQDVSAGSWMSLPEIREGLEQARQATGRKMDVIGFDACLMASAEVAHELRNETDYLVASQEVEGGDGWPYTRLLTKDAIESLNQALLAKADYTPRELAAQVVHTAEGKQDDLPTMAAIDMAKIPTLTQAVDKLAGAVVDSPTGRGTLRSLARETQRFTDYKDLFDFAKLVATSTKIDDAALKQAAQGVMDAVADAVIAEEHSPAYPDAHGLTIQLPNYFFSPKADYKETAFAQDTRWDEANKTMGKYWFWPWPL